MGEEHKKPDARQIPIDPKKGKEFIVPPSFRIRIDGTVYKEIHKHCEQDSINELGGVLIGDVFNDRHGAYIEITAFVKAEGATSQNTQLTFTQETWEYINTTLDNDFPDKIIVGWYHSHPGHGVFLSDHDIFIQKNFFSQPFQVAYVIDNQNKKEGFFVWNDGEPAIEKCFWVDDEQVFIQLKEDDEISGDTEAGKPVKSKVGRGFIIWTSIGFVISILLIIYFYAKIKNSTDDRIAALNGQVMQVLAPNAKEFEQQLNQAINQDTRFQGGEIKCLLKFTTVICIGRVHTEAHKVLLGKLIRGIHGIDAVDLTGVSVHNKYRIQPGDMLTDIAKRVYGNPDCYKEILRLNQRVISNPNSLTPMLEITLPEIDFQ
jgi:proteasome lid subunit RPN8/RPN11/phage tail protein X